MLDWLKTILGDHYTEDIDKQVSAEIGKGFVARADFNTLNEEKKRLATQVTERDTQLEELKKVDTKGLQAEITRLQGENAAQAEKHKKELDGLKLDSLLEARLLKEGAVNTKAVRALLDQDKISLDGDNLLGLDDQLAALKGAEKWAFAQPKGGKSQLPLTEPPDVDVDKFAAAAMRGAGLNTEQKG